MQPVQRNRGTEIIVAIVAFSAIVLSVVFAIVLTLDSFRPTTPTPAVSVGLTTATETITQQSNTDPATDTETPSPTETASPTPTAEASPTLPASDTPRPSRTRVTATPSPTHTATDTEKPQSRPTEPTATRRITAEASRTPTAVPTVTATATVTATVPATPTVALTARSTPTRAVVLATPVTEIASPLTATVGSVVTCPPPAGWQPYAVQSGQNLFRIALAVGLPLNELQQANCITDASTLIAGQTIYVPPGGLASLQTAVAQTRQAPSTQPGGETTAQLPLREGCTLPNVTITTPQHGAVLPLTQPFIVRGTATLADPALFSFYKVEVRAAGGSVWNNVIQPVAPVPGPAGELTVINPVLFGPGIYQIALTVVDMSASYPQPCIISVIFR